MKRKRTYKMPHRRRREQKTDYRSRLDLLKSKKPRLVIRKSSNSLSCQVIDYNSKGDKTVISVNHSSLKKLGWKAHGGNIPSAYLVGLLCGTEAKKKNVKGVIADLGLYTSTKWSRIYAALKGFIDSGVEVPHSKDILPTDERVGGKHISDYAESLKKDNPDKYKKIFSSYLKGKLSPEELGKHFEEIKKKIATK
jgi:large subunit ribosomal protein L18